MKNLIMLLLICLILASCTSYNQTMTNLEYLNSELARLNIPEDLVEISDVVKFERLPKKEVDDLIQKAKSIYATKGTKLEFNRLSGQIGEHVVDQIGLENIDQHPFLDAWASFEHNYKNRTKNFEIKNREHQKQYFNAYNNFLYDLVKEHEQSLISTYGVDPMVIKKFYVAAEKYLEIKD